jgi:hypothetical protein
MPVLVTTAATPNTTTTFNDWVQKVHRRVYSGAMDATVQVDGGGISAIDTTFKFSPSNSVAVRAGAIMSVDYELMYVTNVDSGTVTVVRGYEGSTAASHAVGALAYIQPKYTMFDIAVQLNDELLRLSSPDNGLFRVGEYTLTWNPVYMGYDLGNTNADGTNNPSGIPANFLDVLEVRHKIPYPTRNYPKIGKWKVLRNVPDAAVFPSGAGIVFYEGGYPGQPVYVQYSAPFTTVDLTNPANFSADITTLTGMSSTMVDIPPLGAEIQLTLPREIKRNFMESQPDPRKAPEIPPLAVSNSVQALMITYNTRISEEAARLQRQYTRTESW